MRQYIHKQFNHHHEAPTCEYQSAALAARSSGARRCRPMPSLATAAHACGPSASRSASSPSALPPGSPGWSWPARRAANPQERPELEGGCSAPGPSAGGFFRNDAHVTASSQRRGGGPGRTVPSAAPLSDSACASRASPVGSEDFATPAAGIHTEVRVRQTLPLLHPLTTPISVPGTLAYVCPTILIASDPVCKLSHMHQWRQSTSVVTRCDVNHQNSNPPVL